MACGFVLIFVLKSVCVSCLIALLEEAGMQSFCATLGSLATIHKY